MDVAELVARFSTAAAQDLPHKAAEAVINE
ncbi:MAG: hypothetical protein CFH40_02113, partial [Alphaproteobacteria bacterium MarineAlpha10_Bin3]